jgi:hypothetical protein
VLRSEISLFAALEDLGAEAEINTVWETVRGSRVKLNLQPTVSRPVHLGVGPSFGAHDQILHVL